MRLRDDLRQVYRDLRNSLERARQSSWAEAAVLRLGIFGWNLDDLRPLFDALAERRPDSEVRIRVLTFADPFGPLRAGELDAMLPWLPIREPDLTVGPVVFTEPIVMAMSATDPLAQQDSVSLEALADRTVIGGAAPDYWRHTFIPTHTPSGRPITIGPKVASFDQEIPLLLTGEAIAPVTAQARRLAPHPGIAYPHIRDAPLARFALVWRTAAETDLIRTFASVVTELGPIVL